LDGLVPVALHTFMRNTDSNDVDERACPYAGSSSKFQKKNMQ